nr:Inner membrane transport permease YadH [Candidatus Pantoea persica]
MIAVITNAYANVASSFFSAKFQHNIEELLVALTLLLTAILFSLAGLLNAVFACTFDDISLIPTFVLTPLTYLGGVFYSLSLPFWQAVSKLNPIVYMISSFRFGFLGINDVPPALTLSVLIPFILVFYVLIQRGRGLCT